LRFAAPDVMAEELETVRLGTRPRSTGGLALAWRALGKRAV